MRRPAALFLFLTLALPTTAEAQASQSFPRWTPPALGGPAPSLERTPSGGSIPGMVAGGLIGGGVGFVGGALLGGAIGGGNAVCGDDACGLEEAAYGAVVGQSVFLPLGVHLANRRRGNYLLSLLASSAIGAAGVLAIHATNDGAPFIAVPVLQLVSSILIERRTGRRD